jgi:hypothetical protein
MELNMSKLTQTNMIHNLCPKGYFWLVLVSTHHLICIKITELICSTERAIREGDIYFYILHWEMSHDVIANFGSVTSCANRVYDLIADFDLWTVPENSNEKIMLLVAFLDMINIKPPLCNFRPMTITGVFCSLGNHTQVGLL